MKKKLSEMYKNVIIHKGNIDMDNVSCIPIAQIMKDNEAVATIAAKWVESYKNREKNITIEEAVNRACDEIYREEERQLIRIATNFVKENFIWNQKLINEMENKMRGMKADVKDNLPIVELGGWKKEEPDTDCYVLLMTEEFPKNCFYIVAEWDNDAKCFYSEASDMPIKHWDCWKLIERNEYLKGKSYRERLNEITNNL